MKRALTLGAVLLASCSSSPVSNAQSALIINASAESRAELQSVVSSALGQPSVLLAHDALTKESLLLIERPPHRDANGVVIQGRELGMPERFALSKQGKDCVLTHERSQQHWVLKKAQCALQNLPL